ncbi:MAG: hypothetical protein KKG47_07880 [Proteobacteria bacterium]|nr:hypothetical protein [Pseudomonadota bacterium]
MIPGPGIFYAQWSGHVSFIPYQSSKVKSGLDPFPFPSQSASLPLPLNIFGTMLFIFDPTRGRSGYLLTAAVSLFFGIWIEKGFGLIIPGFVPSPMGEVVDYAPTFNEILITLGVLATGAFVVTILIKPALKILLRYKENAV